MEKEPGKPDTPDTPATIPAPVADTTVRRKLLLVEDDAIIALSEKQILQSHGYDVVISLSGQEAIDTITADPSIELVLMDIDLGNGLDGTDTAEIILREHDIPILFISSHTEPVIIERTEKITSYGYIVKGSSETALNASIKMAFKLYHAHQELKLKNNELKRVSSRLSVAQQAAATGIWDWDVITGCIEWTPELFVLFGLVPAETAASFDTWRKVLHPEDVELAEMRIKQAVQNHTCLDSEYRIVLPDGQIRWINALGKCNYDAQGNALDMTGICIDITEKMLSKQALADSRTSYRLLFENIHEGYTYCRMMYENGQPVDFIYLEVNPAFRKLTGLEHVTGKRVTEVIPGIREAHPELFRLYHQVASSGKSERIELCFKPLDIWLSISVYSDTKDHFIAVFETIAGKKTAMAGNRE